MKRTIKLLIVSVLSLYFITGCSADRTREDKAAAMIGKIDSPFFVVSMTPQNLMDKSGILDGVLPFTYELVLAFFIDESVSGVDYSVKTHIVVGKGESFQPNFYGIFKVKDEKKFVDMIEKEANADIVEKDGFKTAVKESDGYAVVWNEEFAIISNIPMDFAAMLNGTSGGGGEKTVNSLIEIIKAGDDGEVNATYAAFLNKDADLSMYYDGKGFYGYLSSMMGEASEDVEKMKDTYEGITSEIYINFNDGSIDIEFINTLSDKLKDQLSFIADKGVSGNLLTYANSPTPILIGGYNFDIPKFFEYFETQLSEDAYSEMEKDINEMGLTMDEVKTALTGEIVYMIDRIESVETTMDYGYGEPYTYTAQTPMFGMVIGVSNPAVFQKVLVDSLKLPNGAYQMGEAIVVLDGNVLFMTNDSTWSNKVIAKTTSTASKGADVLAANPFAFYVDFASMSTMEDLNDVEAYVKLFTEFSGGLNLDGGKFTFKMVDASKNALRLITETVSAELTRLEVKSNESMEAELEEAFLEGLDSLNEDLEKELP